MGIILYFTVILLELFSSPLPVLISYSLHFYLSSVLYFYPVLLYSSLWALYSFVKGLSFCVNGSTLHITSVIYFIFNERGFSLDLHVLFGFWEVSYIFVSLMLLFFFQLCTPPRSWVLMIIVSVHKDFFSSCLVLVIEFLISIL